MTSGQGSPSLIEYPGFSILLIIYLSGSFKEIVNLKCSFANAQLCHLTLLPVCNLKNIQTFIPMHYLENFSLIPSDL